MESEVLEVPTYFPLLSQNMTTISRALAELEKSDTKVPFLEREVRESLALFVENSLLISAEKGSLSLAEAKEELRKEPVMKKAERLIGQMSTVSTDRSSFVEAVSELKTELQSRNRKEEPLSVTNMADYTRMDHEPEPAVVIFDNQLTEAKHKRLENSRKQKEFAEFTEVMISPQKLLAGEDDDDVAVEGGLVDLRCPISKQIMNNPVTSKKCGHCYDKNNILSLFGRQSNTKCPECPMLLSRQDLIPDELMKVRVEFYNRDLEIQEKFKSHSDIVRL
ncbi:unnamed protein product [Kuraishia capsulata CBS 1993]|uniref:SP-RING-type domain-containing protein n=1 Tax=Kuraishia capsulata CBS 1993 TaxID=1382522 RepID=W6MGY5_9ASCO|nr:uncharacterized protein KUCA_T00000850001 [Kuraishia capsulata CBS 1993]CDK24883.1 unnamed protein product [Kuraishia capsulata CBS 1993]